MRAFDVACATPWLATESAVRQILSIANRETSDTLLAEALRSERELRPSAVAMQTGRPLDNTSSVTIRDGVAIIPVTGTIFRYANLFTALSGATSTELLARDIQAATDSPMVSAILLSINSPGGEATGIHDLADAVFAVRGKKPICAFVEGLGASAAYWIASAADEIVLEATAAVGSIGAVLAVSSPDPKATAVEFVSSQSPNKRADPTTESGRNQYQSMVDDLASVFIDAVARNRGMQTEDVISAGGAGGMKVGKAAITAGLADRIDSFEGTLQHLKQQAVVRKPAGARTYTQGDHMDWKAFWGGMFGAAAQAEGTPIAAALDVAAMGGAEPSAGLSADAQALKAQLAEAQAALAAQAEAARITAATAWANTMVSTGKALPIETAKLIQLHTSASADDARDNGGRTAMIEELIASRPAHTLTKELVTVPTTETTDDARRDREAALLAMTPLGRNITSARKN